MRKTKREQQKESKKRGKDWECSMLGLEAQQKWKVSNFNLILFQD